MAKENQPAPGLRRAGKTGKSITAKKAGADKANSAKVADFGELSRAEIKKVNGKANETKTLTDKAHALVKEAKESYPLGQGPGVL